MNVFEFESDPFKGAFRYLGSGIDHGVLVGPGRPDEGHLRVIPQAYYTPEPPATGDGLVVIRGPMRGASRSGLTLYGLSVSQEPVSVVRLGWGWVMKIRDPQVVRWRRPTGRAVEAHCVAQELWPESAILVWGNALGSVALCGTPLSVGMEDLGSCRETVWLPTRRWRTEHQDPSVSGALYRIAVLARWVQEYGLDRIPQVPPWAGEDLRMAAVTVIEGFPEAENLDLQVEDSRREEAAVLLEQLRRDTFAEGGWMDREAWERWERDPSREG